MEDFRDQQSKGSLGQAIPSRWAAAILINRGMYQWRVSESGAWAKASIGDRYIFRKSSMAWDFSKLSFVFFSTNKRLINRRQFVDTTRNDDGTLSIIPAALTNLEINYQIHFDSMSPPGRASYPVRHDASQIRKKLLRIMMTR
ncbi:unnamed protein product [Nesidiocoris tenuis]|uniref:Uncharacterized protein n=1 Tax=Nesidiocoris tenuis TaxID=355587 RepID=A0A6H5GGY5_9HEMI|nr:unnamed protein product [Nesidiocoris tenuis]